MGRLILAIIAFGTLMIAMKLAILAIVVAGLIFRPRQTVFVLLAGGTLTLIGNQPLIGVALLTVFLIGAALRLARTD